MTDFLLRISRPLLLAAALVAPSATAAEGLDALASAASSDLQKALTELSTVRKQIEGERLPLAAQLREVEQKLIDGRAQLGKAQRFQENQLVELNALKAEAKRQSDEVKYVDSLLSEYARAFRSRLHFIEEPRYQEMFDTLEKASASPDLSPLEKFSQRSVLLAKALSRSEAALGGELFEGKALNKQGRVEQGKVAVIGPVAMFAGGSPGTAGLLQQELNKADPTLVQLDRQLDEAGRALVTTGTGELALDATLGNAFKLSALRESLFERLAKGGLIMIPLLGLGAGALVLAFVKWVQLARIRSATEADLQKVLGHLESGQQEKALAHARGIPGLAGNLLATAVENAEEKREYIEDILYEQMLGARAKLERGLAFLALAATAGPLMGLLGTVMGMIATFKVISSFGSGDPKTLAAGISEALICTATGMAVAIPSLLLHAFLSRKAKGIIGSMEQTSVGFLNGIPDEAKSTFTVR